MHYSLYRVKGRHAETNQFRTRKVNAKSEDEAIAIVKEKELLVSDYEVTIIPHELATDRQLRYATDLGIEFPHDITKEDLSALMSRELDPDPEDCFPAIRAWAEENHLYFSEYLGVYRSASYVFNNIDHQEQLITFIWLLWSDYYDDWRHSPSIHPYAEQFKQYANEKLKDERFITSFRANVYGGRRLVYPTSDSDFRRTIVYKDAINFIHENELKELNKSVAFNENDASYQEEPTASPLKKLLIITGTLYITFKFFF